jgi:hypothetical protein
LKLESSCFRSCAWVPCQVLQSSVLAPTWLPLQTAPGSGDGHPLHSKRLLSSGDGR